MMTILFRVDAHTDIGYGHLRRCLALADGLKPFGRSAVFAVGPPSAEAVAMIEESGHAAIVLPAAHGAGDKRRSHPWLDANWPFDARRTVEAVGREKTSCVVVDHYGLDARWERVVREHLEASVVVVDGLANRRHDCDLLVDPTYHPEHTGGRWSGLLSSRTRRLVGPAYALLRPEFSRALATRVERDGTVDRVLIAFGGSDPVGATKLALNAFDRIGRSSTQAVVVAGSAAPDVDALRSRCLEFDDVSLVVDTDEMGRWMAWADLAVGGAGTMTWERAFMGLPAVVVAIADHQVDVARPVADVGAIVYAGTADEVDEAMLREHLEALMGDPARMRRMSRRARSVVDRRREVGTEYVARAVIDTIAEQ